MHMVFQRPNHGELQKVAPEIPARLNTFSGLSEHCRNWGTEDAA